MSQIFVYINNSELPRVAVDMAQSLSRTYSKQICLLSIATNEQEVSSMKENLSLLSSQIEDCDTRVLSPSEDFTAVMEQTEASMLLFQVSPKKGEIMKCLKLCRNLRIPYFFCREEHSVSFQKILVPITFLIEEREKGPFSSSFGRFFKSHITLYKAKDYGTRAQQTVDAIDVLLDKAEVSHDVREGSKDSFKVEREAAELAKSLGYDLVICSASREYGIDDVLFGPRELKTIKNSTVPVMLINPRGDLYTLCG